MLTENPLIFIFCGIKLIFFHKNIKYYFKVSIHQAYGLSYNPIQD